MTMNAHGNNAQQRSRRSRKQRLVVTATMGISCLSSSATALSSSSRSSSAYRAGGSPPSELLRFDTVQNMFNAPYTAVNNIIPTKFGSTDATQRRSQRESVSLPSTSTMSEQTGVTSRGGRSRRQKQQHANALPERLPGTTGKVSSISGPAYGNAATELYYRNGKADEAGVAVQERASREEEASGEGAISSYVSVTGRLVSWSFGRLTKWSSSSPEDDFDRYVKFLEHRYHRFHDDDICFDDRIPEEQGKLGKHVSREEAMDALGLSEVVQKKRVESTDLREASGKVTPSRTMAAAPPAIRRVSKASALPAFALNPKLMEPTLQVIRRMQIHRAAVLAAQRKLVAKYTFAVTAATKSLLTAVAENIRWDTVRSVRNLTAIAVAVSICLYRPLIAILAGTEA